MRADTYQNSDRLSGTDASKNEEYLTAARLSDAAGRCYNRGIPVFTDFLDINRQSVFTAFSSGEKGIFGFKMPPVSCVMSGGYDLAERKVIIFLPYEDFPYEVPFDIIKISPVNIRFAEELTHRDYLGAVMGLGIVRDKFGDIIVARDGAYIIALKSITPYITDNLNQVKHTAVTAEVTDYNDFSYVPDFKEIRGTVASLRLDSVIALGFGGSRSRLISYIENGKVAVNGKIITSNAYSLKPEDIVSVRGLGRIKFISSGALTKKGRTVVVLHKYI